MKREEVRGRKIRNDKKKDVKPTIAIELYDCIARLSYVTSIPMKDIGVELCRRGIRSHEVTRGISSHFKRSYQLDNSIYIGRLESEGYKSPKGMSKTRITLRFNQNEYENIFNLNFALGLTVSSTTGLLLERSVKNMNIVKDYLSSVVDLESIERNENKKSQLNDVFKYIRKDNPYNQYVSFSDVLKYIYEEARDKIAGAIR